jgi:conserved hypothetical protein|nr:MAG TPA: KilA protein [Caudoviricetes sp.]
MNSIQNLSFNSVTVSFRQDGFLNASAVAKHFGKAPKDYLKSEQTQQYIAALAENLSKGRKIPLEENQLVIVKHGGNQSGTWLHPKLAIHFARWLDPRFAVWCDEQIEHILSGSLKLETQSPTFSQSELRKLATVTYYCAWATQMLRDVAEPLHALGYEKAITMRTLANESRLFLHDTHKALTREMPKIDSAFERADMQNSLTRCEFLM